MSPIEDVASFLIDQKDRIGLDLVENLVAELSVQVGAEEMNQGKINFSTLVELMGKSLIYQSEDIFSEISSWSHALGHQSATNGEKLDETLQVLPLIRAEFIRYIGKICEDNNLTTREIILINERLNYALDLAINETIKAFDYFKEQTLPKPMMKRPNCQHPSCRFLITWPYCL